MATDRSQHVVGDCVGVEGVEEVTDVGRDARFGVERRRAEFAPRLLHDICFSAAVVAEVDGEGSDWRFEPALFSEVVDPFERGRDAVRSGIGVASCAGLGHFGESPRSMSRYTDKGLEGPDRLVESSETTRRIVTDGGVDEDRIYRDPEGRRISVVIGGERLKFSDEQSGSEFIVFERDHRDLADLDPEDRPRVTLETTFSGWTSFFYPKESKAKDRISLEKHEERSTDRELHAFGEGAPDVIIEYLELAECEEGSA